VINASQDLYLSGKEELTIGNGVVLESSASRLFANSINLKPNSVVYDIFFNELKGNGTILGDQISPLSLPLVSALPAQLDAIPASQDVIVEAGETLILHSGSYANIEIKNGARIILSGGLYSFDNWSIAPSSNILFRSPAYIVINGHLAAGPGLYLGPESNMIPLESQDIRIYILGSNSNSNPLAGNFSVDIGPNSTLSANLFAENGTIRTGPDSIISGALIARWVYIGPSSIIGLASTWD
jgi:hypothetical protein